MLRLNALFLLMFVSGFSCSIFSQTPAPSAQSLVNQCATAMGQVDRSTLFEGSGTITDEEHQGLTTSKFNFKSEGRTREVWSQNDQGRILRRTVNGWSAVEHTDDGKTRNLSGAEGGYRIPEFDPAYLCSQDYSVRNGSVQYLGQEQHAGLLTDHLRITMKDSKFSRKDESHRREVQTLDVYLDVAAHTVSAYSRRRISPQAEQNALEEEFRFSNYQLSGGVLIPHTIHLLLRGRPFIQLLLLSITPSTTLSSSDLE